MLHRYCPLLREVNISTVFLAWYLKNHIFFGDVTASVQNLAASAIATSKDDV